MYCSHIINDKEAGIVKTIFKMYIAGNGYGLIAQELNESGNRTKLGRSFSKGSIRDILLNEKYTGTYIFNKRLSKKVNHKYKDDSEIIRIEDAMPLIISKEDFICLLGKLNVENAEQLM